ncbi:hypothetical protein WJX73_002015 [Symbiochloris irregularis]|uniref:Photosystem II reaction center Psb28 protein n=1 Tax=Symbiochloris irregularis TaxID=706552 RepID=A0AAW1NNA7_9CHLO
MWTALKPPANATHIGCPKALARQPLHSGSASQINRRICRHRAAPTVCMASKLQFIKGLDEPSIPDVKLTRSRDGSNGTATFIFPEPAVLNTTEELGEITGLYMIDDEGTIQTVDVSAKFVNGKPDRIEAVHVMKTTNDWDRFMRFMERYAEDHDLGFNKK